MEVTPNPQDKKSLRSFGLTNLAVDNSTSIFLLTFMVVLFGVRTYNALPKEAFPEVPWPKIYVNTVYFGNAAQDIENLVTRPLEKELASVDNVKNVTSSSLQDYSLIVVEFDADVDLDDATRKVKDAVDKAKPELPDDLTSEPEVLDINLSEIPIMTVNLSGNFSLDDLRSYAEDLQDKLEELDEIASVALKGDQDREVQININLPKMEAMQIAFGDIENAIRGENLTMSGGEILTNDFRRSISVIGEFKNVEQINNVIVKSENQQPVYLRDIAGVNFAYKDRTSIARADGLPVISLDVIKRSGKNLLLASDNIKNVVNQAKRDFLPSDLNVSFFNDLSVQTRDMVSNLENSIISGVLLVVVVLLFFMGIRNAMFVGIAIPLSMLLGIMFLGLSGYTLNMVVLFSLILALGMLVDNAIVVVENIFRYMQNGYSSWQAAKYATAEVAVPIIASTATTVAAFLPLAFWPGLMGSFMQYLPITLIAVLSASLFVALVINPVVAGQLMKVDARAEDPRVRSRRRRNIILFSLLLLILAIPAHLTNTVWLRNSLVLVALVSLVNFFLLRPASFAFQQYVMPALEQAYHWFIGIALKRFMPVFVFLGTFVMLIISVMLLGVFPPKVTLFPEADPLYVNAFVELPLGTDISATDGIAKEIEQRISKTIEPYRGIVEAVLTQIGENTSDPNGNPDFGASPHKARLTVSFVPSQDRGDLSTVKVMEELRESVRGIPGVQIVVDQNQNGPPTGKPINLEIRGEDMTQLAVLSEEVVKYINQQNIPGIEELKADVKIGKPELIVDIDREAARRYELSTFSIADAIRTAVFGKEISRFKEGEEEYPITIRLDETYRNNIDQVLNQRITFRSPATGRISQVPISAVADVRFSSTFSAINRKDQKRMITVSSNVLDGYNANEIVNNLQFLMAGYNWPNGYSYEFTGEQQEQAENTAFLSTAFLVAIFAIFIIIVAQFNSLISPFIIMLSVLFSTIGVFLAYVVNKMDIVIIMTGVGIISLAGVVVNNAIVLIDYTNLLIRRKWEEAGLSSIYDLSTAEVKAALVEGGATRLRPVLLTAITTVLGLVPLAVGFNFNFFTLISETDPHIFMGGDNADFWGTMAWTVIYGLIFATFLTLIVVPAMYWIAYRMQLFLYKWTRRNDQVEPGAVPQV